MTDSHEPARFEDLHWQSLRLRLRSQRRIGGGTSVMKILQALLGHAAQPEVKLAFQIPGQAAHRLKLAEGEAFVLVLLFFGGGEHAPVEWLQAFTHYLATAPKANFDLLEVISAGHHGGAECLRPVPAGISHAELECLTPLPFKRPDGADRTGLTLEVFVNQLRQRVKSLTGLALPLPDLKHLRLLPWYWHYDEPKQASKSQPGEEYYNGCVGPLYFSGELSAILPWLRLAEAFHAGGKLALNPLGYCRLHLPARPYFDARLGHSQHWLAALDKVRHAHDDWNSELAAALGAPLAPQEFCAELGRQAGLPGWQPEPALAFDLPKRDGTRQLEKLPLKELVLHTGLQDWLAEPIDRQLGPAAMGYRRGRSVQKATACVREAIDAGYHFAVQADIEDFFPSVNLDRLEAQLDGLLPPADAVLRGLLHKLLRAGYRKDGELVTRQRGLAQGSPLSPLFANLYLEHFDAVLSAVDAKLVRYADDFVILTRDRAQAEKLLERARGELARLGLALSADKTAVRSVEDGFRFLGQPFGGAASETVAGLLAAPTRKTVYVTEPYCYLGRNGEALEIRHEGRALDVIPLRRIADILLLEPAMVSTALAQRCSALGIPLVMGGHGRALPALIVPASRRYHAVAQAQTLHYARLSPTEKLALAKAFAARKIENYKPLLTARYQAGHAGLLAELDAALEGIEQAADTRAVRGHEGHAARCVQQALNGFIKVDAFHFSRRDRHEPDRMNGLFNFGYHLLFCRLNALVRGAGLNPYLGFLHDGDDDYESLVCDIEELFRAPVDRLLLSVVNLRIIQADDFHDTPKGLRLHTPAVKRFLQHFEQMLHSDAGGINLRQAMEAQVEAFKRYVTADQPLWFFQYKAPHDGAGPA
jgi:CRISPR-associated protein Cas1